MEVTSNLNVKNDLTRVGVALLEEEVIGSQRYASRRVSKDKWLVRLAGNCAEDLSSIDSMNDFYKKDKCIPTFHHTRTVTRNEKDELLCTCGMFEATRIPCRHIIHVMDRKIELLDVGVCWRSDYYAYYGNPSCVRISNAFDTYQNRNDPVYPETNGPSIFPVLKYGHEVEEAEEQDIDWKSGTTCINYSSAFDQFQKRNEEEAEINTMILDFETVDGMDVTSSKRNETA